MTTDDVPGRLPSAERDFYAFTDEYLDRIAAEYYVFVRERPGVDDEAALEMTELVHDLLTGDWTSPDR
jgi:hypothetical protein